MASDRTTAGRIGQILHAFKYHGRRYVTWGTEGKVGGHCSLAAWRKAIKDGYVREENNDAR